MTFEEDGEGGSGEDEWRSGYGDTAGSSCDDNKGNGCRGGNDGNSYSRGFSGLIIVLMVGTEWLMKAMVERKMMMLVLMMIVVMVLAVVVKKLVIIKIILSQC